jgi:hypothetical protein
LAVEQEIMRLGRALGKFEQAVVAALLGAPAGPSTGASGRTQDERSPGPRSGTPRATPRTED